MWLSREFIRFCPCSWAVCVGLCVSLPPFAVVLSTLSHTMSLFCVVARSCDILSVFPNPLSAGPHSFHCLDFCLILTISP
ncbi:hypothetical protein GDO81_030209 [Engystomops pustulosus]|uniref:Secreted protein n=1 Tax=Engystomops pustulosus TaxID=76066 RepID=A0AAV6Z0R2_ENGPU|nr:hypothetical protein GDO81_030209 [Engystomops pustulosus]